MSESGDARVMHSLGKRHRQGAKALTPDGYSKVQDIFEDGSRAFLLGLVGQEGEIEVNSSQTNHHFVVV